MVLRGQWSEQPTRVTWRVISWQVGQSDVFQARTVSSLLIPQMPH